MKSNRGMVLALAFLCCSCMAGWSQAGPVAALEEIATATKVQEIEKHLPAKILQMIDDLPPKEKAEVRQEMAKEFLLGENLKKSGLVLRRAGDGRTWEVVQADGELKGTIAVKNSFISGVDALVLLQATDHEGHDRTVTFAVSMLLEDGEWRITGGGDFHEFDLESEAFFNRFRPHPAAADTYAASFLRTLTTDLITYSNTYPAIGFPASLNALSGAENSEASPDHAKLLEPAFATGPIIRTGFEFRYTLIDPGNVEGHEPKYRLTATALEFGKMGTKNFFTDETAVIRFTTENREANENDTPL
jgi:hypothetical protein